MKYRTCPKDVFPLIYEPVEPPECKPGEKCSYCYKPESILSKIEALKDNACKEGVCISEICLRGKEYMEFINTPVVSKVIHTLRLGGTSRSHIMWDGIHILNNALPLDEKKNLINCKDECNHENYFASHAQSKHLTVQCIDCKKNISLFQIIANLLKRVKELENK